MHGLLIIYLLFFVAGLVASLPVFAIAWLLRHQRIGAWIWAWLGTAFGIVVILQATGVIWAVISRQ
ncbi:MAG TPA: hypothetical protein VN029_11960 [Sphingomonas sp.]|nr:hypothetical protein [Sphingomonas sp.]